MEFAIVHLHPSEESQNCHHGHNNPRQRSANRNPPDRLFLERIKPVAKPGELRFHPVAALSAACSATGGALNAGSNRKVYRRDGFMPRLKKPTPAGGWVFPPGTAFGVRTRAGVLGVQARAVINCAAFVRLHAAIRLPWDWRAGEVAGRARPLDHWRRAVICSAMRRESGTKSTSTLPTVRSPGSPSPPANA